MNAAASTASWSVPYAAGAVASTAQPDGGVHAPYFVMTPFRFIPKTL
jgi:hypothetical protein